MQWVKLNPVEMALHPCKRDEVTFHPGLSPPTLARLLPSGDNWPKVYLRRATSTLDFSISFESMAVMIKLKVPPDMASFEAVQSLPGLVDLNLDPSFGLVAIDPKDALYVVRAETVDNLQRRRRLSPEIIEQYGDIPISGI